MGRMQNLALQARIGAALAEVIGLRRLGDRRKIEDFVSALIQQITDEIIDMDPLHDDDGASRRLVIGSRDQS